MFLLYAASATHGCAWRGVASLHVKAQILSSPEISSFQEAFSRVLRTETSSSTPPSTQMSSALVGHNMGESEKQQFKNSGPGGNSRGTSSGGVVFYYCHKPGHVI